MPPLQESQNAVRQTQKYPIGEESVVCVEHPFIVKDFAKAIVSLGGPSDVAKVPANSYSNDAVQYARKDCDADSLLACSSREFKK